MKQYTEDNSHLDRHKASASGVEAATEWFNQFEDRPGVYDVYDIAALESMKKKMLSDFVKKINEID